MAKHLVICVDCGTQFDANRGGYYDPLTRRYTCKRCYKLAQEVIAQMDLRRQEQKNKAENEAMYEALRNQKRVKTSPEIQSTPRRGVVIEALVWLLVLLCLGSAAAEYAGMFELLPAPIYPCMGASVVFGVAAWALSGKL